MRKSDLNVWLMGTIAAVMTWCGLASTLSQTITTSGSDAPRAPGVAVRGQIAIPTSWTLQKPDLTRTVIYFASSPALDAVPPPATPAVVAQRNKTFDPGFIVISSGTTVEFPNQDPFDHNVFSRSPAAPAFDLLRYPKGMQKTRQFIKTGAIQLFCNIHPDMRAIIFVAPNTFFIRADREGRFEIKDVPPGDYELIVWNERCDDLHEKVKVETQPGAEVSLTLRENRARIMANSPPKDKDGYGIERGLSVKREVLNLPVVPDAQPVPTRSPAGAGH